MRMKPLVNILKAHNSSRMKAYKLYKGKNNYESVYMEKESETTIMAMEGFEPPPSFFSVANVNMLFRDIQTKKFSYSSETPKGEFTLCRNILLYRSIKRQEERRRYDMLNASILMFVLIFL